MRLALFDLDHTLLSADSDVLWCEFLIDEGELVASPMAPTTIRITPTVLMSMPFAWSARIADSRPAPGPVTRTSTERTPFSFACSAQLAAASWAAKGVPLREPLKPMRPADDQASTPPS